jgi:hypothetical protein
MEFDFDAWAKLARENPEEFERQRTAMVRATIESAPAEHRKRLEGLQFQIDLERQRSSTPLGACIRLNSLMWSGFHRLRKELNGLVDGPASGDEKPAAPPVAEVIPMERFAGARRRPGPGAK